MFSLTKTTGRQREIIDVVLGNGWDYMRGVLTGRKTDDPKIPPPEVLRKILVELGPFYVKLGQLLSTRPDILPPEYIKALTALQANVPPVPWPAIETVIEDSLNRPVNQVFPQIETNPIAAGSIGQIHRATLENGEEVAIKVRRPGIDRVVSQDIALIKAIAELVSLTDVGQDYDIVKLTDEFSQAITAELDFTKEAYYTNRLSQNLAQSRWVDPTKVTIPKVYWDYTSEKMLVIEWLEGRPILQADLSQPPTDKPLQERKEEITTLLFRSFFQQLYIDGFFHADPHPGNIFYLNDGRVAIIDCGMVGKIDPRTQQILTELLLAIFDLDAASCSQLTLELSESPSPPSIERLQIDYERMLRKYYDLSLNQFNFSEVVYESLQIARKNKIKLPGTLGLYAKCLANLEGAGRQFNPEINLFEEIKPLMVDLFRRQLVGDTPFQTSLRTVLDLKSIALKTPRQAEVLLERLSTETLQWNLRLRELDPLRRSVDSSANRLSFSIVLGSLIMGAAIISTGASTRELSLISDVLFAFASLIGIWLIVSILRSGRLR